MLRDKITNLLEYALVIWIIFDYFTVYMRLFSYEIVSFIGVVILAFLLIVTPKKNKKRIITSNFILYLIIAFFIMVSNVRYQLFATIYLVLLPLFYLYFRLNVVHSQGLNIGWFLKFSNVTIVIAIVSLFFWIGSNVLGNITPTGYFPNNWGEQYTMIPTYYNVYFETQEVVFLSNVFQRNTAIFTEAPVCNLIFCFAFSIEIYIRKQYHLWRKIVLFIAIMTTFSTTGQLFLITMLFIYVLLYMKKNIIRKILLYMMPIIGIVAYSLVSLLIEEKSNTGSFMKRSEDIIWMINAGLSNPILGKGFLLSKDGVSNSFFHLFAECGLSMLLIYLYYILFIPFRYYKRNNDNRWLLLNISFFFLFIFTVAYYKCLDIAIIAYTMANCDVKFTIKRFNYGIS